MFVFAAREAWSMWIASRASDVVAPDAELLARSMWQPAHDAGLIRACGPWSPPLGVSHPGGCGLRVVDSGATPIRV